MVVVLVVVVRLDEFVELDELLGAGVVMGSEVEVVVGIGLGQFSARSLAENSNVSIVVTGFVHAIGFLGASVALPDCATDTSPPGCQ